MQRSVVAEQARRSDGTVARYRNARQEIFDQFLLLRAQGFADGSAVKPLQRGGIAFLVRTHAAPASRCAPGLSSLAGG